ncbi:hypothetical protein HY989_06635 [Candidatus Micrarchaeota archaeon]|nr:hypothetical protein [Candidatus Micrarchaeota archaeon]
MNHLITAHNWLAKNSKRMDKYAGKWIAVGESKLLGVANSLKELKLLPAVKNAKEPLFTAIPSKVDNYSLTF